MQKASVVVAVSSAILWMLIAILTVVFTLLEVAWVALFGWADRQRRVPHAMSGIWGRAVTWLVTGGRLTVQGRRHLAGRNAVVLVANHQSILDTTVLYALRHQFKWVAKSSLRRVPFLGWSMRACGYIPLERGTVSSIRATYAAAKRYLAQGMPVMFFPEGTRSTTPEMLPFKNGAFKLAIEAGVPVVPVAISGTRELLVRGSWIFRPLRHARVTVLAPIDPAPYAPDGAVRLRETAQRRIAEALAPPKRAGLARA